MRKFIKSFWGVIPFMGLMLCIGDVLIINKTLNETLRAPYRNGLMGLGVISFGIFLIWGNKCYAVLQKKKNSSKQMIFKTVLKTLSVFIFTITTLISLLIMGFNYQKEYIVTKNNLKMVACVRSFSRGEVYYYAYKNALFYGRELGYEYYGSDKPNPFIETPRPEPIRWTYYDLKGQVISSGPLSDNQTEGDEKVWGEETEELSEKAEMKTFNHTVKENRKGELVFEGSIDDFIASYNGYYWADKNKRYLRSSEQWIVRMDKTGIHSPYPTLYYYFTENEKIWSLPTLSVYVPDGQSMVQEITVNYDDHSYSPAMRTLYEEICFYTLKVFFPDLEDAQITALYTKVNQIAYDNIVLNEQGYKYKAKPFALFYKDNIGVYPYFAIGECLHLCIIPVNTEVLNAFEKEGVEIHEIK